MRKLVFMGALAVCIGTANRVMAGDAESGAQLVHQWCTSCHIVDKSAQGADTAPPFPSIARRRAQDPGWVRSWLSSPHPPMPNFNLSRQQIDDIVAYLDSLKPS